MIDFQGRIEEILTNVYSEGHDHEAAVKQYNEGFREEGLRKTRFVLNKIEEFDERIKSSLGHFVALSVGGSDASDLLAVVSRTPIRRAILLEYDNDAAARACAETLPAIKKMGGTLDVVVGDAVQQLDTIRGKLKAAQSEGFIGLLCLCLAVIHELPKRSSGFDLNIYLGRLTSVFPNNLVFLSEPCSPREGNEDREFKVSTIHEDRLAELARHVNAHLFNNEHKVQQVSGGFVRAPLPLIVETLHKLLRYDVVPRFRHEMGERLTQFTPEQLKEAVRIALPDSAIETTDKASEGFRKAYLEGAVVIRDIKANTCPIPTSHVQVTAVSLREAIPRP